MMMDQWMTVWWCWSMKVWFQNARAKYRRSLQRGDNDHRPSTSSAAAAPLTRQQSSSLSTSSVLEMDARSCCNTSTATSSVSSSSASSDLQLTAGSSSDWSSLVANIVVPTLGLRNISATKIGISASTIMRKKTSFDIRYSDPYPLR